MAVSASISEIPSALGLVTSDTGQDTSPLISSLVLVTVRTRSNVPASWTITIPPVPRIETKSSKEMDPLIGLRTLLKYCFPVNFSPSQTKQRGRLNICNLNHLENFFSHFKEEALCQYKNQTFQEAQQIIDDYFYFNNYERIQLKTRQTPFQIRCLSN